MRSPSSQSQMDDDSYEAQTDRGSKVPEKNLLPAFSCIAVTHCERKQIPAFSLHQGNAAMTAKMATG